MPLIRNYLYGIGICIQCQLYGITIVYNLRIAETTKTQIRALAQKRHSIAAFTAFAQCRKLLKNVHQSAIGGLGTYIYMKESFYARANAAVARVHTKQDNNPTTFARTQFDDILFTVGYALPIENCFSVAISLHLGVPTHKDTSLQFLQFGTGHVAFGGQLDAMYAFDDKQACIAAARFLHFFPRTVDISIDPLNRQFNFTPGNVADLLFAYEYRWKTQQIEIGYNPTFIFDAHIQPFLPNVLPQINTISHNFFGSYRYGFLIKKYPNAIIFGTSIGVVPLPERFGNTHITTVWFSWGINF